MTTLASVIGRGLLSARPAAATAGRLYFATDTPGTMYRDNGSSWDSVETSSVTNPMTTKGDLIVGGASGTLSRLGVGSNDQVLTADSAQTLGVKWATPSAGGSASVFSSAFGSPPSSPSADDLWNPSDNPATYRYSGSAWLPELIGMRPTAQPPAVSGWTKVNDAGSVTWDESKGGIRFFEATVGSGVQAYRSLVRTIGTNTRWRAYFLLNPMTTTGLNGNQRVGIVWKNSGGAAIITWEVALASGAYQLEAVRWNNSSGSLDGIYGSALNAHFLTHGPVICLEAALVSGNRKSRYSVIPGAGVQHDFHSIGSTNFITADQIGVTFCATSGDLECWLLGWEEA